MQSAAEARLLAERPEIIAEENPPPFALPGTPEILTGFWQLVQINSNGYSFIPYSEVTDWLNEHRVTHPFHRESHRFYYGRLLDAYREWWREKLEESK